MGGVTSSQADSASALFLKSPSRFFLSSMVASQPTSPPTQPHPDRHIIGTPGGPSLILPNHSPLLQATVDPATLAASTQALDPKRLVEYIQDPDPKGNSPYLLKLPANTVFKFKISIQAAANPISNLTFIAAPSCSSLDNLLINEFLENPNIQNEENVVLLGDYASEQNAVSTFEFIWKASPPLSAPLFKSDDRGMKLVLCFAEYDKRDHSLKQLARFVVWLEPPQQATVPKINTSLEPLPELIESPLQSTSSSPLLRDSASPNGASTFIFPQSVTSDLTRLTIARSDSPTVAKRNSIGSHSTPPPPSFPAPAIPASPDIQTVPYEVMSPMSAKPDATEAPPISSMLLPDSEVDISQDRDKRQSTSTSSIPRPGENNASQPEDGPLFRATIAALEKKTGILKAKVKKLLKRSIMVHERQTGLVEAHSLFLQSIQEVADTEIPSFQPLVQNFFHAKGNGPYVTIDVLRKSSSDLQVHVVDPLRRLYEQEIKVFDQRKRDFDDESREYYAWLSRYLSVKQEAKGKKKSESDSKYAEKRKAFELRRFDYYSYLQDLHGGRKQQLVTYNLGLFAELEVNRYVAAGEKLDSEVKDQLLHFVDEIKEANKEWTRQRTERELHRRAIERSTKDPSAILFSPTTDTFRFDEYVPHDIPAIPITSPQAHQSNSASSLQAISASTSSTNAPGPITLMTSASSNPSKSVEALRLQSPVNVVPIGSPEKTVLPPTETDIKDERLESSRRKEGLLWAMSRPGGFNDPINLNKTGGWHKFWVVLAAGKLCEYTNWKQGLDLHNDPINLKVALVREARNAERRFCFEVVTPHYKRVYQATSEEDMQSWIRSINNGISSSLEGSAQSIKDFSIGSDQSTLRPTLTSHSSMDSRLSPVATNSKFHDDHHHHQHDKQGDGNNLSDNLKEEFAKINSRKVSLHRRTSTQKSVSEKNTTYKPVKPPLKAEHSPAKKSMSTSRINEIVYAVDPSNRYCADCGAFNKVEWISINLLAILCIDCSGVHRSLGSHISKVRSLTLDTVSFTPELISLIKSVSNSVINSIWEARLPQPKNPAKVAENRAAFIREKYMEKKYVDILDRPNAYLRTAVQNKDIVGILKALASRANTNTCMPVPSGDEVGSSQGSGTGADEETVIMYALRNTSSASTSFPIAELLILNTPELSAAIPSDAATTSALSPHATKYIQQKISPKSSSKSSSNSQPPSSSMPPPPVPGSSGAGPRSSTSTHVTSGGGGGASSATAVTTSTTSGTMVSIGSGTGASGSTGAGGNSSSSGSGSNASKDEKRGNKFQKRLSFGNSSKA